MLHPYPHTTRNELPRTAETWNLHVKGPGTFELNAASEDDLKELISWFAHRSPFVQHPDQIVQMRVALDAFSVQLDVAAQPVPTGPLH